MRIIVEALILKNDVSLIFIICILNMNSTVFLFPSLINAAWTEEGGGWGVVVKRKKKATFD